MSLVLLLLLLILNLLVLVLLILLLILNLPPRATGQAHRPAPPVTTGKSSSLNKTQAQLDFQTYDVGSQDYLVLKFISSDLRTVLQGDADKARKHGMEEYIAADPITFEHHALFKKLQSLSLDWRLNDPFASLVSFFLES